MSDSAVDAAHQRPRLFISRRLRERLTFFGVLIGTVIIWQLATKILNIAPYVLPDPLSIWEAAWANLGDLLRHTRATAVEIVIGFLLAAAAGIILAALMHYFSLLNQILAPLLVTFQTIPKVALAPLFVIWFGYSLLPRVLVAATIAFFPILIDTLAGLRAARPSSVDLVRSLGGSRWAVFREAEFPSALPQMFAGLKVAATLSVIGAVVGEYIVANEGLGYLQLQSAFKVDAPMVFASVIMMALLGLLAYELVVALEKILVPWGPRH